MTDCKKLQVTSCWVDQYFLDWERIVMRPNLGVLFAFVLLIPRAAIAAPDPQLYGKTVVVTYTNVNVTRPSGSGKEFRTSSETRHITLYVSTTGRSFMKFGKTNASGASQVGDSSAFRAGTGNLQIGGRAMTANFVYPGGATQVQVEIDSNFQRCTAAVVHGKAGKNESYLFKSSNGVTYEVKSSIASNVVCSIREGNAFAG